MLPHHTPRWLSLVLAVSGGLLTDAGFPDVGVWVAAIVGVTFLYLALRRDAPWWNFLMGFAWAVAFFLKHIGWAQYAVGDIPWAALSILEALFVAVFAVAWTFVRRIPAITRRTALHVGAFSVLFVAAELTRSAVPFGGFPWGRIAFSQSESPLGRLAWLGGMPLVSFATVAAAVLLALGIVGLRRADLLTFGATVIAAAVIVGAGLLVPLATQAEEGTLRVGAVQGNVAKGGLDAFDTRREVLDNHVQGTHALLDQVETGWLDIVLWPENGTDIDPQVDAEAATAIDDAAHAVGAPLLLGAQEFPDDGGRYNVALLWAPGVGVVDRYAKQHPAPFAEYIPIRELVRPFSDAVDLVRTDMLPGTTPGTITLTSPRLERDVIIGDVICFEVAYDELVRESILAGGEILVVQTNNASFGPTNESTQQLAMSQLRAIETGRTTIQISTVGVSAVIAPNGTIAERTGLFTAEQLVETVALRTSLTPAVTLGAWPARSALALAVGLLVLAVVRRPGRHATTSAATAARPASRPVPRAAGTRSR